ncbi:hypothetical protein [Fuerstiella marisgermanici]|uniref:hypothetical protein n=1 Tax=Fuerstiella marisgermanici TaxID=1891926 RepID=UPI001315019F|nr:hypothetical protein [Fuerstiella marisgermanici]
MAKRLFFCLLFCLPMTFTVVGCGGGVEPGVASGPDEPEPEMTEEEEASEAEAARSAAN